MSRPRRPQNCLTYWKRAVVVVVEEFRRSVVGGVGSGTAAVAGCLLERVKVKVTHLTRCLIHWNQNRLGRLSLSPRSLEQG